ncbi:MAG: hypothetical protein NBV65_14315, partial [Burkholderiaceae bacterium]|nr:hypothetical protein [Burkholderiaceae bacterium]
MYIFPCIYRDGCRFAAETGPSSACGRRTALRYNDRALGVDQPGRGDYPVIADPDYTGINQLYVDWTGPKDTRLRLGRQS